MSDFRFAFRSLSKSPGFTVVAVVTLALGIGLSTTIFNGVNPLLFRALPFHEPDRLVFLTERNSAQESRRLRVSLADFTHWRNENRVFSELGVWTTTSFALGGGELPERIEGGLVSTTLFPMLGLQPVLGRAFAADEHKPGAAAVVLLGDGLWHSRFGGDPAIVGRTILLNGSAHTVIGIMPPRVRFPNDADLWVPLVVTDPEKTHGTFSYRAAARLRPDVTPAQAQADLDAIQIRIAAESPATNTNVSALVEPIEAGFLDRELRTMGWTMLGSVAFVLAVACANVASLFLTRSLSRHREFAVRAALGAGRWRTLRQLLAESLLIGTASGSLGLLFSVWGLDLVLQLVPVEIPYWIDFTLDGRVLAFTVGVSLLTSVVFGLIPAWQASRLNVQAGLSATSRGSGDNRRRHGLRGAFVVGEVALATLLLCGTGLMIRSLLNLQRIQPGFDPDPLAVFYLDLSSASAKTGEARAAFLTTLTERLRALPGAADAAACSNLPLSGSGNYQSFAVEGRPPPAQPGQSPYALHRAITPGYFSTMGIPLVAGRDFAASDSPTSRKVVIIDAAFARAHFAGENPLGRHLRWNANDPASAVEIVGIAGDVRHGSLNQEPGPGLYVPYAQSPSRGIGVVLRTSGMAPADTLAAARQVLREIDPLLPSYRAQAMRDMISETFWINRFLGKLLVGFAGLALALAAVGIASVMAYAVAQRTREIGVRMALGAQTRDVLRLVLGRGFRLVLLGLGLGLIGSLGLNQALASQLHGIGWLDPFTLGASAGIFMVVALLACWLPARRATRVNPVEALRAD